jgi:hypothetical protein
MSFLYSLVHTSPYTLSTALAAAYLVGRLAFGVPEHSAVQEGCATRSILAALELFKLCLTSASLLPKLQEAERIARGFKVVTNAQASPQSPSEWTVRIYQPTRPEPLPQLESGAIDESDEWQEAE